MAPTKTAGWMKIAEILVAQNENTSILDADIENCTGGYDTEVTANWTTETDVTYRIGSVSDFKALFRVSHDEDGDECGKYFQFTFHNSSQICLSCLCGHIIT